MIESTVFVTPVDEQKRKRKKMIISILLIILCLAFIAYVVFKPQINSFFKFLETPSLAFDKKTEDELFELANSARSAGLQILGSMQCSWTQRQLDLFGPPGSKARSEIEKIYVECTSREICPDVRGFPTWSLGPLLFPGFRDGDNLRQLITDVKEKGEERKPKKTKVRFAEKVEVQEEDEEEEPEEEPKEEQPKEEPKEEQPKEEPKEEPKEKSAQKVPEVAKGQEEKQEKPSRKRRKKEFVRGVSSFQALNVPNMPGAPVASVEHHEYQALQGDVPRHFVDRTDLAKQMAQTLNAISQESREGNAALLNNARLPHSVGISTGNPMDTKSYLE